jgi:hypothetical protein
MLISRSVQRADVGQRLCLLLRVQACVSAAHSRREPETASDQEPEPPDHRAIARCPRRLGEDASKQLKRFRPHAEVSPVSALFAFDESGLVEDFQVVADRGLAQSERFGEVADACLFAGLSLDKAEEAEPSRVGEDFQRSGELVGLFLGEFAV